MIDLHPLELQKRNFQPAQVFRVDGDAYRSAVNGLTAGLFGLSAWGALRALNSAAEEMVQREQWFERTETGVHVASRVRCHDSPLKAIARLQLGIGFRLLITDPLTGAEALLHGLRGRSDAGEHAADAAFVWTTPLSPTSDASQDLAQLFGLTSAETRIVSHLAQGKCLRQIADHLQISIHTARVQLKSVLRKSGRASQSQLLLLVSSLSALRRCARPPSR